MGKRATQRASILGPVRSGATLVAMSTANHTPSPPQQRDQPRREHDTCDHPTCDSDYVAVEGVAGHCSITCARRHRGRRLLNILEQDHRFCATCYGRLKDVSSPGDEWRRAKSSPERAAIDQGATYHQVGNRIALDATGCNHYRRLIDADAVTGLQSRTAHGRLGEVTDERPQGVPDDTRIGTICECGNASVNECNDLLQAADIRRAAENLIAALEAVHDEGQTDHAVNDLALVDDLRRQAREHSGEGWDFALAVGRAVEAD